MEQKETAPVNPLEGCPDPLLPILEGIAQSFSDVEFGFYFFRDEATITVPVEKVIDLLRYLKETKAHAFDYLVDVGGYQGTDEKYMVFYNLLSINTNRRLRVKTPAPGDPPAVPTATVLWESANWHEREAYDMYGIIFEGHPDLRRMFLPEHVKIHPLRKDYPLKGDNDKPTW